MAMLFRTHFKLARTTIKKNRSRSFLTCLGIAIGVASIVLILSLTGSISNLIQSEVNEISADLIVVRPTSSYSDISSLIKEVTTSTSFEQSSLTLADAEDIKNISGVSASAPIALSTNAVISEKNTLSSVKILGTTSDFSKIESLPLKYGSFLTETTNSSLKPIILGHTVSLELFNTINSTIGKTVEILGEKFIVVGVLDSIEQSVNFDNIDFDNTIIISIDHLNSLLGSIQIQQINIKAINTDSLASISEEVKSTLSSKKSGDETFSVAYGDDIVHPANSLINIISSALTLVASISLIVGGIGVMNIMLVSVAERTHEIGIRKAVGASSLNILFQFLFESLILSFLGSIFGLILGYVFAFLISTVTPFVVFISWDIIIITFCVAIIVGVIFGIYPAVKAALRNPIESLRRFR